MRVSIADRGREGSDLAEKIGRAEFERHFVVLPRAEGKGEAGIEDLVDRSLYYEAFKEAYRGMLDSVPGIDEIDADGGQKRSDNYLRWLEESGNEYSRTLVAQRMFNVVLGGGPARGDPDMAGALERTSGAFADLFAAIKSKY